jgi:hypothetical protein
MEDAARRLGRRDAAEKTVDIIQRLAESEGKLAQKDGNTASTPA